MGQNRVIGKDNDLIWHLPADMRFFRDTTIDHIVVMGRKNWDSIPTKYRPLARRLNCVLTRDKNYSTEGALVFNSIEDCQSHFDADEDRTFFVIGGAQIYNLALEKDIIEEMYITHIQEDFEGDTFFPEFEESTWLSETVMEFEKDEKNPHSFIVKRYWK